MKTLAIVAAILVGIWAYSNSRKKAQGTQSNPVTIPWTGIPEGIYTGDTTPWIVAIETYYNGVPYGYDINSNSPSYQTLMPYYG
jgi:hypothetical protein